MKLEFVFISILLIAFLVIGESHSIRNIHKKVQQIDEEFDKEMDSEIEKLDSMAQDLDIFVKNFDYYVPSTKKPTELTTSLLPTKKEFKIDSVGESSRDNSGSSGIIIIAVVVIVIIVVVGGIGGFFFVKKSKKEDSDSTNANKRKGVDKTLSKESMFSIATVNSVTGAPVHSNAAKKAAKKR
jgi:uncharacterized protein YneF (UPF0154 family)